MVKKLRRNRNSGSYLAHKKKPDTWKYIASATLPSGEVKRIYGQWATSKQSAYQKWENQVAINTASSQGVEIYNWDDRTVVDLCLRYADNDITQSGNTYGSTRAETTKASDRDDAIRLSTVIKKIKVKDFTVDHALDLRRHYEKKPNVNGRPYSPTTIARTMKYLRRVLEWAYLERMTTDYVFKDISKGKEAELFFRRGRRVEIIYYTRDEVIKLCADDTPEMVKNYHLTRNTGYFRTQNKLWVELSFVIGTRVGETTGLVWGDIFWGDVNTSHLPSEYQQRTFVQIRRQWNTQNVYADLKTPDSRREIPLNWSTSAKLQTHYEIAKLKAEVDGHDHMWLQGEPVFKNEAGKPMAHNALRIWLRRQCDNVGINRKGPHAFRRGFATERAGEGATPDELSQMLGHAKGSNTALKYYTNTNTPAYKQRILMAMVRTEPTKVI